MPDTKEDQVTDETQDVMAKDVEQAPNNSAYVDHYNTPERAKAEREQTIAHTVKLNAEARLINAQAHSLEIENSNKRN